MRRIGLLALLVLATLAQEARAAEITQCTRTAVANAAVAGGSYTFACDGRIVMNPPLQVSQTVSFDASGHTVSFAGGKPDYDTTFATGPYDNRVVKVLAAGDLTLRGITIEDGLIVGKKGVNGAAAGSGADGASPGAAGGPAPSGAKPGTSAEPARGGCIMVEAGGRLVLRALTIRRCQAAASPSGLSGATGGGGRGAKGAKGVDATGTTPAGPGGAGGAGGAGPTEAPVPGPEGGPAEGGAVYSAGVLDVGGVRFEDNLARGGRGGTGGGGGGGGYGGAGGNGGNPYGTYRGGDGGPGGASGSGAPGAAGGAGGAARGGAVFGTGAVSISGSHFARNTAIGGYAGFGGDGGSGAETFLGYPGRVIIGNGPGDPACAVPGDRTQYARCGQFTSGNAGTGGPAGLNGDGGPALGGALFLAGEQPPPVNTTNDANVVQGGDNLAAECASNEPWRGCGKGGTGGRFFVPFCEFDVTEPRCARGADGAKGVPGKVGRAADADAASDQADGLRVAISYDGDDLPGYRFPLDEPVTAHVKVSVAATAAGPVKGIAFDEGAVLFENEADHVRFTGTDPPQPFTLEPGGSRELEVQVIGTSRGATALRTGVSGKDELGRTAEAADRDEIRVGEDIRVGVTVDPAEVALEVDDGAPVKKPVTITVSLENTSEEALTGVKLDLRTRILTLVGYDPTAPYPLQVTRLDPGTPLDNDSARAIDIGSLAIDAKKTLVFHADAANKGSVEIRADATGTAAGPRTVVGSDRTGIDIDQPKLLAVEGGAAPPSRLLDPGEVWRYDPVIKNISPDEDVMVRVLTDHTGNVYGRPILDLMEPPDSDLGDIKVLEPGERWLLGAQYTQIHDGGTRGTIDLEVNAWTSPYATADAVDPDKFAVAAGALSHTVSINDAPPDPHTIPLEWAHAGELGWMFTENFVSAGLRSMAAPVEMVLGAPAFVKRTAVATWYGAGRVWSSLSKEEISGVIDSLGADLQALGRYETYAEARGVVDTKLQALLATPANAYYDGDAGYFVGATGSLLGSVAGDALTAKIGSAAYAKFLKEGIAKRALARSFEEQAATLAGRTAGVGEVGRAGLKAGDLLDLPLARRLYGIDRKLDGRLLDYARRNKLLIAMRDRSPGSIARLAEGLLPKIEKVKAKNVNSIDIDFLGFAESHRDVAMIKQMPDWDTVKAGIGHLTKEEQFEVFERWSTRLKEWNGPIRRELEGYHLRGSIPVPGGKWGLNPTSNGIFDADQVWSATEFKMPNSVDAGFGATKDNLKAFVPMVNSTGKKGKGFWALTGDMDAIAILDENMQLLSMERRTQVYKDLARMGFQHPESLTWDNAIGRAKYLSDYDRANRRAQALLAYTPAGERRAVYFDSRKSTWELAGAAGGNRRSAGSAAREVGNDDPGGGLFMLDGAPMSWDAPTVPITPFEGDVTEEEDPDAPMYLTPAGDDGATLSDDPDAPTVRRNPDGSYSTYGPGGARAARRSGAWAPYTRPAGVLRLRVQSGVREPAAQGAAELPVFGLDDLALGTTGNAWFSANMAVLIDPGGAHEEAATVAAAGTRALTLTAPLARAHEIGELIIALPAAVTAPGLTATPTPAAAATPRPTATPTPHPARDTSKPRLTRIKLSRTRFSLTVSEAATITVTVARKRGKRYRKATAFRLAARKAGPVKRKVRLRRGRYRLTIVATDAAGNRTKKTPAARLR